jgi:hypothetical protein
VADDSEMQPKHRTETHNPWGAIAILCLASSVAVAQEKPRNDSSDQLATRYIVILGSSRDFPRLHQAALSIGRRSGVPFSMVGLVYDRDRGLIVPDDDPDEIWRGAYVLRRSNAEGNETNRLLAKISIEKSGAYPGLKSGLYIIVGGIYDTPAKAGRAAARYRAAVPDAYVRKTNIYMGCMH